MATSPRPVPPTVAASPPTSRSPSPTRQPSAGPDSPILEGLHGAVNEDEEENSNVINTILRFLRRRRRWVDGHLLGSGQEGDRGGEGRTEVLVLDQVEWEVYERAVSFLEWERVEGTGGWRGLLTEYDGVCKQMIVRTPDNLRLLLRFSIPHDVETELMEWSSAKVQNLVEKGKIRIAWLGQKVMSFHLSNGRLSYTPSNALSFIDTAYPILILEITTHEPRHTLRRRLSHYLLGSAGNILFGFGLHLSISKTLEEGCERTTVKKADLTVYSSREVDVQGKTGRWEKEMVVYTFRERQEVWPTLPNGGDSVVLSVPAPHRAGTLVIRIPMTGFHKAVQSAARSLERRESALISARKGGTTEQIQRGRGRNRRRFSLGSDLFPELEGEDEIDAVGDADTEDEEDEEGDEDDEKPDNRELDDEDDEDGAPEMVREGDEDGWDGYDKWDVVVGTGDEEGFERVGVDDDEDLEEMGELLVEDVVKGVIEGYEREERAMGAEGYDGAEGYGGAGGYDGAEGYDGGESDMGGGGAVRVLRREIEEFERQRKQEEEEMALRKPPKYPPGLEGFRSSG